jgi:hypothetical protein
MATTNIQTFSGDVDVTSDLNIGGETILGTATYRKRRDWNRNALAYVYLGNVRTSTTTGIRLDVSMNNSNSGYQMYSYYINLFDDDPSHTGGYMTYSCRGAIGSLYYAGSDIGYVYVNDGTGLYTYQLWLADPLYSVSGPMDAYINCQGYYVFDTEVSDVAQGGAAPTNFNLGTPCVITKYTGNVGIGSTNPVYKLDVTGTAAISSNLTVGTANLHVDTNTGNIGIGKASPISRLDVSDLSNSKTTPTLTLNHSGVFDFASPNPSVWQSIDFTTEANGTRTRQCGINLLNYSSAGTGQNGIADRLRTGLGFSVHNENGMVENALVINKDGNVGIGTVSPGAKLHLVVPDIGNTTEVLRLENGDGTGDIVSTSGGFIGMHLRDNNVGGGEVARISWKHDGTDSSAEGLGQLGFWTSNTGGSGPGVPVERMTIRANGNVGIGTANPSSKLHIDNGVLVVSDTSETNTNYLIPDGDGSGGTSNQHFTGNTHIGVAQFVSEPSDYNFPSVSIINKDRVDNTTKNANIGFFLTDTVGTGKYAGRIGFWPESSDAIKNQFRIYTTDTSAGYTYPVQQMVVTGDGNVGIGSTNPSAQLTLGASSGSQIQVTNNTRLLSNTHYLNYATDASATFEQVLLQFDTGGTGSTDQSEYAGYVDVEMVAQRTQSTYNIDAFTARLNYMLGWNEQSDTWQVKTFIQENTGRQNEYRSLESTPVFKYKYVDRQLQIYVSFDARQCRSYTSFTARVTSDNLADVSTPGADALMASGTVGTAEVGICYGVGTNAANVGIGTTNPSSNLHVNGDVYVSSNLEVGTANLFVDTQTGNVGIGTESPSYKLDVHGTANVGTLYSTLTYSNASANIVAWNTSTNEVIDSGLERGFTEHPVETFTGSTTYNANIGTSGEFPPSTHYIEGHGTYEAWASTQYNVSGQATREVWKLFDGSTSTYFQQSSSTDYDKYNVSSPYEYVGTRGTTTTDVGGTRYMGVWVQLKLPYTITLAYTKINNWTSNTDRSPGAGVILGSNDGDNWYKLSEFSGLTYTSNEEIVQVNATTPYQYYRMVTTNTVGTGTINFTEWRLFAEKPVTRMENVHISGELSSETLQTGYIKWPKVPLKAVESEGYVASASENTTFGGGLKPWKAFNNIIGNLYGWSTFNNRYNSDGTLNTSTSFQGYDGHWLKISMPQSIVPSFMLFYPYEDARQFMRAGKILASNDEITWDVISSFSDVIRGEFDFEPHRINISAHKSYSSFAVVVSENNGLGWLAIDEWEIYESTLGVGTSATTAKLTVDGGLGLAKGSQVFAGSDVITEFPKHDRPLTKYPEVAMTSGTMGGYTTSSSSDSGSNYRSYKAFDGTSSFYITASGKYNTSNGSYTGSNTFEGIPGETLSLTMPKKIKLQHIRIRARSGSSSDNAPKKARIFGSNDNSTWVQLWTFDEMGLDFTNGTYKLFVVNAEQYYNAYTFVIEEGDMEPGTTNSYVSIRELEYYGHEEGDESVDVVHRSIPNTPGTQQLAVYYEARDPNSYSFADSSNVYDLSGNGRTGTLTGGVGFDAEYNAFTFDGVNDYITSSDVGISGAQVLSMSAWLKTNSSGDVARFGIGTYTAARCMYFTVNNSVNSYYIVCNAHNNTYTGSFSANTWLHVTMIYLGGIISTTTLLLYINGVLQTPSTGPENSAALNLPSPCELRLGRGIDGGYTSGSIANFRLFSKVLNADQVWELYEYDAERFGHRQNLVALHKGNLGVGVAHPTSRFEVAGADGLQEYPPKAMTGYETYIEGHGVFRASQSSPYPSANYNAWKVFDKSLAYGAHFLDSYSSTNDYIYDGAGTRSDGLGGFAGEWVKLEMPYAINLKSFAIAPASLTRAPEDFVILGSNDGTLWTQLANFNGLGSSDWPYSGGYVLKHFTAPNTKTYYKYFAIVVTRTESNDYLQIDAMVYYGTPAPSSLEDGHLTLGKALTLPRVSGHAAGAETPRAESLVVHYDTTVDSVVSGSTVVDISGEGNNGTFNGNASYSSTDRALVFDGTGDYVDTSVITPSMAGAQVHSMSAWFKSDTASDLQFVTCLGEKNGGGAEREFSAIRINGSTLQFWSYSNDLDKNNAISAGVWYHVVAVYLGGGTSQSTMLMYLNGERITSWDSDTTDGKALNLVSPSFAIGEDIGRSDYRFDGLISNPKLWNVALTAEEVAMEYALGRTGKSLNLTDTALCLGGTVPRAQLDVRGAAEISKLGIGVDRTNFPTLAPLTIHRYTYDGLGGGLELTRLNTPDGNGGLGYNRSSAIWHAYSSTNSRETLYFAVGSGDYGTSSYDYTRVRGYIDTNNSGGNITFTGQHRAVVEGIPIYESEKYKGLIVSSKSNKYVKLNGLETGSNAITINESVPLVSLSNIAQDKSCFGVISDSEDPDVREDRIGNFVTTGQKEKGDARVFINSVGEGAMWVVNTAGPLESGDYITTSNVAGYGQKQESDSLKNYTVAKITMDCDFEPATQPIQRIKQSNVVETHYTGLVPVVKGVPHEWVTTTVTADDEWSNVSVSPSDVTYAEWSNLEANVQNTYTLTYTQTSNVVYDVKYTKTTTANVTAEDAWDAVHIEPSTVTYAEYSNLEANVQNTYSLTYTMTTKVEATEAIYSNLSTEDKEFFVPTYYQMVKQTVDAEYPGAVKHETVTDRLENALDEHGQLQWEDDPSGATEKAYKIRYLDASSQITDEANAVHTAAFVGVTYHCG